MVPIEARTAGKLLVLVLVLTIAMLLVDILLFHYARKSALHESEAFHLQHDRPIADADDHLSSNREERLMEMAKLNDDMLSSK